MDTKYKIIFETNRLSLRELTIGDSSFIIELLNSPGWLKYIGDRNVRTEEEAKGYLLNGPMKSYEENGYGLFLVVLKSSQTPVGMCGLLKREYLENPDIGFAFLPDHVGKGYGFEVANATIEFARQMLNIPHVMAITLPTNQSSIRVLQKVGFTFVRNINSPTTDEELMVFESRG